MNGKKTDIPVASTTAINCKKPPLPEHLVELPGGQWAAWRCVGLRGAGFPAEQVLNLATHECAKAADQIVQAEDELAHTQNIAREALHQELREITADTKERKTVKKTLRCVNKAKISNLPEFAGATRPTIDAFCQACIEVDTARTDFDRAFAATLDHTSQVIYDVARSDRFCEAITWQNRRALLTGVNSIIRNSPGTSSRGSKRRQHEELVANYLQRYCVKNDTIGFFGPVAWARFVSQGDALVAHPGPNFLESRKVFFEGWCIDILAEVLGQNKALRPWFVPRRVPSVYLEGTTAYRPFKESLEISVEQAMVLQSCDGKRTAKEIALYLIHLPSPKFEREADIYDLLDQLCSMGLAIWALEIPLKTNPDQTLRRLLERVEDEDLGQMNLRVLDVLEKARRGVAMAAGNAKQLGRALDVVDTIFSRLTGVSSTRAAGKTYAARTLVYEDCRRDIEVDIGPQILHELGPPLSLLLDSARWFAIEAVAIYRQIAHRVYRKLAAQTASPIVPLANAWSELQSIWYGENIQPFDALASDFQERWARILSIPAQVRRVTYSSEELRPRVLTTFASSQSACSFTPYHAPDVLIAAPDAQSVRRGDYQLVMGELHMCVNTLCAAFFLDQHPSPEEIFQAIEIDQPEPQVIPFVPKQWPGVTTRTHPVLVLPRDFRPAFTNDSIGDSESQVLQVGDMVIEDQGDGLVVRTRDGRLCFDIIDFVADYIAGQIFNYFKIMKPSSHSPRITIDRLVISRESWSFSAGELDFAYQKDEASRFIASRRWAQTRGIPRFVFVKTPIEQKPFYVDFNSPIFVNIFAKYVRRTKEQDSADTQLSVTEMLPDLSRVWLPDAQGQHYTSELRIIAVDLDYYWQHSCFSV
jgi:hypothetical protein